MKKARRGPKFFEARQFLRYADSRRVDDVSGKTGLPCEFHHAVFPVSAARIIIQTGEMNKLLSLLLLALAVVSTQGFAVSSGIPVMGGAVGGT